MSILSKFKNIGSSIDITLKLCDKTWTSLQQDSRLVLMFKANKKVNVINNGVTQLLPWEYAAYSNSLLIHFTNIAVGLSYKIRFVDDKLLVLTSDMNGNNDYYFNASNANSPKTQDEAFEVYYGPQIQYMKNIFGRYYLTYDAEEYLNSPILAFSDSSFLTYLKSIDTALSGLTPNEMVECIDILNKETNGFLSAIIFLYSKAHADAESRRQLSQLQLGLPNPSSKVLDYYLSVK